MSARKLHFVPADTEIAVTASNLFSTVETGLQDGLLVLDIDWFASPCAINDFMIEPIIALADESSPDATPRRFFNWLKRKVGVDISDWQPATITLQENWFHYGDWCYRSWTPPYRGQWKDAVCKRLVRAFAVRHRSWRDSASGMDRAFRVAHARSQLEAVWTRERPGVILEPSEWGPSWPGFVIHGKPPGEDSIQVINWPAFDLAAVVGQAAQLEAMGFAELSIGEAGVFFPFRSSDMPAWLWLDDLDRSCGRDTPNLFVDASVNGWLDIREA